MLPFIDFSTETKELKIFWRETVQNTSLWEVPFKIEDFMTIMRATNSNVVTDDFGAQINCGLVTANKSCCHSSLSQFLVKVAREFVPLAFAFRSWTLQ